MQIINREEKLNKLKLLQTITGGILIFMGSIAILGWLLKNRFIISLGYGYLPAPPLSAVFFVVFGFIYLIQSNIDRRRPGGLIIISIIGFISVYGWLQFVGHFIESDLTFNRLIFPITEKLGKFPLKHMSPYSGFLFFLNGTAILMKLFYRKNSIIQNLIGALGIIVALTGFVFGLGYMFGTPFLYMGNIIPISAISSISFFFTGCGLLFMSGNKSVFLRSLSGPTASARLLRIFIPMIIVLFVLQGIMHIIFFKYLNINEALILTLSTTLSIVLVIIVILKITKRVFQSANLAEAERVKILKEIEKINVLQTNILENNVMGIFMARNRMIEWCNSRLGDIFQIPTEELTSVSTRILFHSDEAYKEPEEWYKLVSSGKISDSIIQLRRKNGDFFWCRFIGTPLYRDKPNKGSIWMVEDITERKRLRERMHLLSHTMESLSECVSITDNSEQVIFVNEAFQKTYGYTQDELLGKNLSIVISTENEPSLIKSIYSRSNKAGCQGVLIHKKKDNSEFPAHVTTSRVLDEKGELLALVSVASDITEQRNAELQLKKYAEDLKASNDAKDKLFSIISHDLRSPFNAILGFSSLLEEQYQFFKEEKKMLFIHEIRKSAQNTYQLLDNMLTWSRTQTRGIKAIATKFDLAEIIEQQIEILIIAAEAKNISLTFEAAPGIIAYADKDMVKTIVLNLINNAIKFTRSEGSINIKAIIQDKEIQVTVADNGVGIAGPELENLFILDKSQSTPGTLKEKGTGLGLLVCKEFVEINGGKIWVKSQQGEGSQFTFTLPIAT
jgi:PAS domain S-box-containing protein